MAHDLEGCQGIISCESFINKTTKEYLETARFVIGKHDDIFDDWLLLALYNNLLVYVYVLTFVLYMRFLHCDML